MIRIMAIAILSLALMGSTTVNMHPACEKSPEQYKTFVQAIMAQDRFVVQFHLETGCGMMIADMPATVLEKGPYWVKVRVKPEGSSPVVLYTSPESIKE